MYGSAQCLRRTRFSIPGYCTGAKFPRTQVSNLNACIAIDLMLYTQDQVRILGINRVIDETGGEARAVCLSRRRNIRLW